MGIYGLKYNYCIRCRKKEGLQNDGFGAIIK